MLRIQRGKFALPKYPSSHLQDRFPDDGLAKQCEFLKLSPPVTLHMSIKHRFHSVKKINQHSKLPKTIFIYLFIFLVPITVASEITLKWKLQGKSK